MQILKGEINITFYKTKHISKHFGMAKKMSVVIKVKKNKRATLYVHDEQKHYLYQTTKSKL